MYLIVLYGPEASGKLTIAKELSAMTGFNLFHNHLSIDVAKSVYAHGANGIDDLIWDVRLMVFTHAARAKLRGMIFTWAPSYHHSLTRLEPLQKCAKENSIEIRFVYITCSLDERKRRVVNNDRVLAGKISTVEKLEDQGKMRKHEVIPETDSLVIDNTNIDAKYAAEIIKNHFSLDVN